MSLAKQVDLLRMSFPKGPGVCSFRISSSTLKCSQALWNKFLTSFIAPPPPHLPCSPGSHCGLIPPLIPSQVFLFPPSLLPLSFRDPALPSYPILTYYCLTTLIFASETRGNQKCFKKLELWREFLVWRPQNPCIVPLRVSFCLSCFPSLLKTFSWLSHFFLPSQALPWWH